MAQYLHDGIARAERDGAAAVIIKLNTPGGALTSTNDIVGTLLEAKVPVIVWVAPAGGFAASAGTFITLASNIALMAPGTSHRRRLAGRRPGRGHRRDDRREDQERRDRQDHRDRPGPPPQRLMGRLDRRSRPFFAGQRGGRARRRRRHRADARGRTRVRERQAGRGRGRAGHARPRRGDRHRSRHEPVPELHPDPVGPDDRVPPVQPRFSRPAGGALQPQLRHRHPRRAGADPVVPRPRGAAAERRRPDPHRASGSC